MAEYSSIIKEELSKFNSQAWWDKKGDFKILHKINPLRVNFILDTIKHHFDIYNNNEALEQLSCLDVGCGGGLVAVAMAEAGLQVTAIDANVDNIITAKEYCQNKNLSINYQATTAEELFSNNVQYEIVLCLEVIEHVANYEQFLAYLAKLLKPGGMIIISTLNRNIKSYCLGIIMAEHILKWVPKNTHEFTKFIKPSELQKVLSQYNFNIHQLKGLNFDLFTNSWQLNDNIDVNYFAYIK